MKLDSQTNAKALRDFADEALAALEARMDATKSEALPPFELPSLDAFCGRVGITREEFAQLDTHEVIKSAVNHFLTMRQHMIVAGGLAGVWPYPEAERLAVEYLGWKP